MSNELPRPLREGDLLTNGMSIIYVVGEFQYSQHKVDRFEGKRYTPLDNSTYEYLVENVTLKYNRLSGIASCVTCELGLLDEAAAFDFRLKRLG